MTSHWMASPVTAPNIPHSGGAKGKSSNQVIVVMCFNLNVHINLEFNSYMHVARDINYVIAASLDRRYKNAC